MFGKSDDINSSSASRAQAGEFDAKVREQLLRDEGLRLHLYRCTAGKLTIGVGRNLDDRGVTREEAMYLLENDIRRCEEELQEKLPDLYNTLNAPRRAVLVNMVFNMGIGAPGKGGLLSFVNTLAYMKAEDWERAANGMLASKYARDTGTRAIRMAEQMRKGVWI